MYIFLVLLQDSIVKERIKLKALKDKHQCDVYFLRLSDEQSDNSVNGGAMRDRTADLLRAKQALSQLSYSPR